jgi:hypothetical protein
MYPRWQGTSQKVPIIVDPVGQLVVEQQVEEEHPKKLL